MSFALTVPGFFSAILNAALLSRSNSAYEIYELKFIRRLGIWSKQSARYYFNKQRMKIIALNGPFKVVVCRRRIPPRAELAVRTVSASAGGCWQSCLPCDFPKLIYVWTLDKTNLDWNVGEEQVTKAFVVIKSSVFRRETLRRSNYFYLGY